MFEQAMLGNEVVQQLKVSEQTWLYCLQLPECYYDETENPVLDSPQGRIFLRLGNYLVRRADGSLLELTPDTEFGRVPEGAVDA